MDFLFADFINNPKLPKVVKFAIVAIICGFIAALGVMLAIVGKIPVAVFFGALISGAAAVSVVYLSIKILNSPDYIVIKLTNKPQIKEIAAKWFHEKWGIPVNAYLESMEEALKTETAYPEWYVAMDKNDRIIGGMGVIENDFHDRKDLSPNVCAVYVEEDKRNQGIAGKLLDYVCKDMKHRGIDTLYLLTDHIGFYEKYDWEFFCEATSDGEDTPSRMYIHKS